MKSFQLKRIKLPFGLPDLVWDTDTGEASNGKILLLTHLRGIHTRNGKIIAERDLGSGVITVVFVNALVSDAVAGTSVVPTFARFKYYDTGTGTNAATDGNTALQTPIASGPSRAISTLSNGQSATTGNHAAILSYAGTITYNTVGPSYPIAVTEWGLFDASSSGNLMDRRVFSAFNVNSGDQLSFPYSVTLPSNS